MKFPKYILPVLIGTNLLAQEYTPLCPALNFGFTHSVYTGMCFKAKDKGLEQGQGHSLNFKQSGVAEFQCGFGIGIFLWMPLNKGLYYKPKFEGCFTNSCLKENVKFFATSFDMSFSNSFAIALKPANEHGVIYMARDMSCYLTSKQPYLLVGPKINFRKYDAGFINKGFQNEMSFGFLIGYGISYEFHGTNFAPEIMYSITSTGQNTINNTKKVTHSITLALNFF